MIEGFWVRGSGIYQDMGGPMAGLLVDNTFNTGQDRKFDK